MTWFAMFLIGLVMLIPIILGFMAGRKSLSNTLDYFVHGRNMGSLAVFFTMYATWWSALAFLGANASYFVSGPLYFTSFIWNVLFPVLIFLIGRRIWFFGKRNNYITAKDFYVHHYGSKALGNFVAVIIVIFTIPFLQIQMQGGAMLLEIASGGIIPFWAGALVFYSVIIAYTWAGGIRAVAWTDVFNGTLIFVGMAAAGLFIVSLMGGHANMFAILAEARPDRLVLLEGDWMAWVSMAVTAACGIMMGPHIWQRMYAVKSRRMFSLLPFLMIIATAANIGPMFVGNTALLLEPDIANPDLILPVMMLNHAPFFFAAFVLVCGVAAAMSTANAHVHAISAVYTIDFHKNYINDKLDEKNLVWIGRWTILITSALVYVLSLYVSDLLITLAMLGLSGTAHVIVPTAGAMFWKRSTAAGAASGMAVGVALQIMFTWYVDAPGIFANGGGLLALIVNAVVFVVVSLLTKPRPPAILDEIDAQYKEFYGGYGNEE